MWSKILLYFFFKNRYRPNFFKCGRFTTPNEAKESSRISALMKIRFYMINNESVMALPQLAAMIASTELKH